MILVLGHSVYLVYTRRSSDAFQNISAGIPSLQTFKKLAVVRVIRPGDEDADALLQSDSRVEPVFHEDEEVLASRDQQITILSD